MLLSHFRKYTMFAVIAIVGLVGCDLTQNHLQMDRAGNKSVQDYRDAMAPRPLETDGEDKASDKQSSADIPDFDPYVARNAENLKPMPIVSVSVNESVPLRDVLYELAKQADYGIELDPRISGSIIFTAKNKPLDVVMERIADMAGLRYEMRDGAISVRLDTPYTKNYKIDYLNIIRENEGSISTDISLVNPTEGGGGSEGTDTGSSFSIESEGMSDFWTEMQSNITTILRTHARPDIMRTRPGISAEEQQLDLSAIGQSQLQQGGGQSGEGQGEEGGQDGDGGENEGGGSGDGPAQLSVDSLDQQGDGVGQQGDGEGQAGAGSVSARYLPQFSVNKQAGMVTVHASTDVHKQLQRYFEELKRSVTSQVLIQAKVMQVELEDEFSAGIEWREVAQLAGEGTLAFDTGPSRRDQLISGNTPENFIAGIQGQDFEAVAEALSRFGTVNTLASPRVTAINNQPAVLNVARNEVYFELDVDRETVNSGGSGGGSNTVITVDSTVRSVPEGVLINVMPSINLNKRQVSMRIRPTITEIVDQVNDPAVPLTLAQGGNLNNLGNVPQSSVPVVDIQEIDSVVNLTSGEAVVIGGLMQNSTRSEQKGVPVLSEMPGVGALFRKQTDQIQKTELVILLRAKILDKPSDSVHQTDKELYREFSQDRRPLDF